MAADVLLARPIGVVHDTHRLGLAHTEPFCGAHDERRPRRVAENVESVTSRSEHGLRTSADGGETGPCVLAGPTCDSADVLYEQRMVHLPVDLAEGDEVRLLSAGAYTSCYSSVGFNGFAPLPTRLV